MTSTPKSILIVDDSSDIQALLRRFFVSEGYVVTTASNGLEALDVLRSGKSVPDLILLDLMMPDMDGYRFREIQKTEAKFAEVPVVIMTASGDIHSRASQIDAKGVLRKPFADPDSILETVERCLKS